MHAQEPGILMLLMKIYSAVFPEIRLDIALLCYVTFVCKANWFQNTDCSIRVF